MCIRRMKGSIVIIWLLLAAVCCAETDGDIRCWTANDDNAYHMQRSCTGQEMFPISERAALAFGKKPCEKCVVVEAPEIIYDDVELWMATRGGTYILCIPAESMESAEALPQLELPETWAFTGDGVAERLRSMLTDSAYNDILKRYEADGWVYDSCRIPELVLDGNVLVMSKRQIEDKWYFTLRPEKSYGAEIQIEWHIAEWDIQLESYGTLTISRNRGDERSNTIGIDDHSGAETVFERDYGNIEITVYRRQGINTAVLRDKSSNTDLLTGTLVIGEGDMGVELNGYLDSKDKATFCCVISDIELGSLVAGKMPQIKYT